jgi:hypothetical protein
MPKNKNGGWLKCAFLSGCISVNNERVALGVWNMMCTSYAG